MSKKHDIIIWNGMPGYLLNQKQEKDITTLLTHKTERVRRTRCKRTPPYYPHKKVKRTKEPS
jgi:hypothetical protein